MIVVGRTRDSDAARQQFVDTERGAVSELEPLDQRVLSHRAVEPAQLDPACSGIHEQPLLLKRQTQHIGACAFAEDDGVDAATADLQNAEPALLRSQVAVIPRAPGQPSARQNPLHAQHIVIAGPDHVAETTREIEDLRQRNGFVLAENEPLDRRRFDVALQGMLFDLDVRPEQLDGIAARADFEDVANLLGVCDPGPNPARRIVHQPTVRARRFA